jgi:hypothetical protein
MCITAEAKKSLQRFIEQRGLQNRVRTYYGTDHAVFPQNSLKPDNERLDPGKQFIPVFAGIARRHHEG